MNAKEGAAVAATIEGRRKSGGADACWLVPEWLRGREAGRIVRDDARGCPQRAAGARSRAVSDTCGLRRTELSRGDGISVSEQADSR
jgi:hypothetical protein